MSNKREDKQQDDYPAAEAAIDVNDDDEEESVTEVSINVTLDNTMFKGEMGLSQFGIISFMIQVFFK